MEQIYRNAYGVSYHVKNHVNSKYKIQLVVNNIGLFMSKEEIEGLLKVVRASYDVSDDCDCEQCGGLKYHKIVKSNELVEFFLKVTPVILESLEDLIEGTLFILNIDTILDTHRIL